MALASEEQDRMARLERAVAAMGSPMRQVFLTHRLESLGYPEIGQLLGLTVAEVERHIADAMLHLVRAMDTGEGGEGD